MANRSFIGLRGEPYTDDRSIAYAHAAAAQTAKKLSMAVSGSKLSHLSEAKNDHARGINLAGNAMVQLAIFDRSNDSSRRAERSFREHLLLGALNMAHPGFVVNKHLTDNPENFSNLAHLDLFGDGYTRRIEVHRNMLSVDMIDDPRHPAAIHAMENGALPGIVNFQMLVADRQL